VVRLRGLRINLRMLPLLLEMACTWPEIVYALLVRVPSIETNASAITAASSSASSSSAASTSAATTSLRNWMRTVEGVNCRRALEAASGAVGIAIKERTVSDPLPLVRRVGWKGKGWDAVRGGLLRARAGGWSGGSSNNNSGSVCGLGGSIVGPVQVWELLESYIK
jgi:hypothetical protein